MTQPEGQTAPASTGDQAKDETVTKTKAKKAKPEADDGKGRLSAYQANTEFFKVPGVHPGGPEELVELHAGRIKDALAEGMVQSVYDEGVKLTCVVVMVGGEPWILDGVQRWRALVDANTMRKAEGKPPYKLPYVIESAASATERMALGLKLNNLRKEDPPLARSQKAAFLLRLAIKEGKSPTAALDVVGDAFGISKSLVDGLCKLHTATPELKSVLSDGVVNQSVAIELAALPAEQQVVVADQARQEARNPDAKPMSTATAKSAVKAAKGRYEKGDCFADRVLLKAIVKAHVEKKAAYLDKDQVNMIRLCLQQVELQDVWNTIKGFKDSVRFVTMKTHKGDE